MKLMTRAPTCRAASCMSTNVDAPSTDVLALEQVGARARLEPLRGRRVPSGLDARPASLALHGPRSWSGNTPRGMFVRASRRHAVETKAVPGVEQAPEQPPPGTAGVETCPARSLAVQQVEPRHRWRQMAPLVDEWNGFWNQSARSREHAVRHVHCRIDAAETPWLPARAAACKLSAGKVDGGARPRSRAGTSERPG